jgi:hypothetical protein
LESASNLLPEKVPYYFVGQPKVLILLCKFSIFKADARVEDINISLHPIAQPILCEVKPFFDYGIGVNHMNIYLVNTSI